MSRIGIVPIVIPQGINVEIKDKNDIYVEGPKGKISKKFDENMKITKENNVIKVVRPSDITLYKSLHGLTHRMITNMIIGVSTGFSRKLEISGVGFKAQAVGKTINLQLGYSHPIVYNIPEGIDVKVEDQNNLLVTGIDKQKVGQAAADIKAFRVPDSYKHKGIKISGEYLRKKAGKSVKK